MFSKLKEKLKSWTKRISETAEVSGEESAGERDIEVPMKFDAGKQKYEPDLEKLKEFEKNLKKKKKSAELDLPSEKEETALKKALEPGTKSFFEKVTSKITKVKIREREFEVYAEELEMLLLENNVALEVAEKVIKKLEEKIVGKELLKKEVDEEIKECFKDIINEILIEPFDIVVRIRGKKEEQEKEPFVILFCGINGTGKTTTLAKIAKMLKKQGVQCVIAAADTFRAASIEQLKKHGDNLKIKVIANEYGADPASVGFDAIQYAKKNFIDCVLIDTAGRIHTSKNLLREIEKISKVTKPDLKIFVGESITGNDIIEQVKSFDWAIGIDGMILAKADIDEKGGTALSVGYVTKKPILFLGTGQEYDAIEIFDKNKFIEKLGL